MISEGPNLIEALPGELQNALNGALRSGEEIVIAVRGNTREALAATPTRLLLLREPAITGIAPVEIREIPLSTLSAVRSEPRPVGGRLLWETTYPGGPTAFDYPTYDAGKYGKVAIKLAELTGSAAPSPGRAAVAAQAAAQGRGCPKCGTAIPENGSYCPSCGLQAFDPCWECGRPLAAGDHFCAFCGTPNTEPAVVRCPGCRAEVRRGQGYCTACGTQARFVCDSCDEPMRREWKHCPACGGSPSWEEEGVESPVAHLRGDEPDDPGAWLTAAPAKRDAEKLNAAGIEAYQKEKFEEAARLFREATEADPNHASYFTNLGVAYGELGDDLQAFTAYRRAIELNPREVQAYLNMGYLYMERERTSEAREMWEKVVRLAPDSDEASEARENLKRVDEL